jgi:tetratricopeptide (TPR) repeat protein
MGEANNTVGPTAAHQPRDVEPGRGKGNGPRLSTLMRRASTLASRGKYDEAIASIMEAMSISPQDPRCSVQLADIYRAQRRMEPAIEAMQRAVELDPRNSSLQEQLLRTLLELNRFDEVISLSHRLLKASPRNIFARDVLGIAYLQQGMLDKALRVTDELIRIDPTDSCHYFKKAVLLQQKGQIACAMDAFTRSLEMDPEGDIADDAREAIAALDSYQLRQVLTLAVDDAVFRAKLLLDADSALTERGFRLSQAGLAMLRQIDFDELPHDSQSPHYH